VVDTAIKK